MNKDIKCTIITVSYNSAETIERTIKSMLSQTYDNYEYIIVDGASKDGTVDIIKKYEPKFAGRLRWISEADQGIYYAMNKGIEMASGELIGIINSDDWYEANALELMVNKYQQIKIEADISNGLVIYGKLRLWDGERELKVTTSDHTRLRENMIAHPSCFVTGDTYRKYGAFNTNYISAADYDFMLRLFEKKVTFKSMDAVIANFSAGGMSASSKAYYDLLKVRKAHRIISGSEYIWTVCKCRISDWLNKRG